MSHMNLTVKEEVVTSLNHLQDNVTWEDVHYHIYILEKIRKGLNSAIEQGTFSETEVEEKLKPWLLK